MMSTCTFSLLWGSAALLVISAGDQELPTDEEKSGINKKVIYRKQAKPFDNVEISINACRVRDIGAGAGSKVRYFVKGSCGPPSRLYFAELMDEYKDKTSFFVGSTVKYRCRPGYQGFKTSSTCLESLEWSRPKELCREKLCRNPGEPANGRLIVLNDLRFGSTVNFICDEGHRLFGPSSIRCIITGQTVAWSAEIPLCQRIPCFPPPDIPHGKQRHKYKEDYYYGDAVSYTCDKGYPHVGDDYIHCTTKDGENGVWSGHLSCGVTPCPAPQLENGGIVTGDSGTYTFEHKVTLGCSAGHVLTGSREIYCQVDGTWDPPVPLCEPVIQCSPPERIANGKYNSQAPDIFTEGTFIEYICEPAYILIGEARIYCTASGTWSSSAPYCEVKQCQRPPNIKHGIHSNQESAVFTSGMSVKYTCEPGYTLIGETIIYCTKSGTWSPPAPHCEEMKCGPPKSLKFAELTDESKNKISFPVGSTVKYMCRPGYAGLRTSVKCLSNLKWSDINEFCRKKPCQNPGDPENGRLFVPEDLFFGSTVNFTCDEGFVNQRASKDIKGKKRMNPQQNWSNRGHVITLIQNRHKLIGQSSIRCVLSGPNVIWSGTVPFCQRIQCYPPPDIPHGKQKNKYNQHYYYGDVVTYTCDKGYTHIGDDYIHCTSKDGENGVWSGRLSCGVTPCPAPQLEKGSIVAGDSDTFIYKHKVTLGCSAGHVLTGSREIYCQADGTWDPPVPLCEWVSHCPAPPDIANGHHNASDGEIFTSHMSVTYFCDPGYSLIGNTFVFCTSSGDWSPPWPHCEVQCSTPQKIANGKYSSQESEVFTKGVSVEYSCEPGYHLIGEATIYCTGSGSWSSHPPYCEEVQCPAPPKVLHGKYSALQSATFTNGKSIKYRCEPGYVLIGEATVYCTASGAWSLPVPRCEVKGCVDPEIQNGRKSSSKLLFKPMEKIAFECDHGYILKGNTTIQCQPDSTWDLPVPLCVRAIQCNRPPQVQNGFHNNQEFALFNHGMSVKYTCEHGYTLIGEATIYCTESGAWTLPAPHCEVLQCNLPPSIPNGEHDGHRLANFPVGTYVNYTCNPGYLLVGDASTHCTASGVWSQPIPQCEVMRCPVPPWIAHGTYFGANFMYQMSVIYVCDAGYSLVGNPMVTCTLQGSDSANWSEPPQCKGCLAPQEIANGKPDTEILEDFAYGSSIIYHCDPGYFLTGAATIYCLSSGMWDPSVPQCKAIGCILPQIPGGRKTTVDNTFQSGDNVTVQCEDGYVLEGSPYIQCQPDFVWDPAVPVCKPGFYHLASISFGSLVGFLLFLAISGIIWMAVSKRNKVRYTPANSKEVSDSSNGRI